MNEEIKQREEERGREKGKERNKKDKQEDHCPTLPRRAKAGS